MSTEENEIKLEAIFDWLWYECDDPIDEITNLILKAYPNKEWLDEYGDVLKHKSDFIKELKDYRGE
jgi:hypothetical protein